MKIKLVVEVSGESFTKTFASREDLRDFVEDNPERFEDPSEECEDYDPYKGPCGECEGCKRAAEEIT